MQEIDTGSNEKQFDDPRSPSLSSWLIENDVPAMCDLHTLASLGDHQNLRKRMERKVADVSTKNLKSWTPLMYACYNGCGKSVQLLVDNGASKNVRNVKYQTALMIAAYFGNCEALHSFPEKIHLDCEDDKGWTALFYAVTAGHLAAVDILLTNGSNVNKVEKSNGFTVSMIAAMKGKDSLLELLLSKGADPNIKSSEGHSTISIAISKENNNLIQVIEKYWHKEKKTPDIVRQLTDSSTFNLHCQNSMENSSNFVCPASEVVLPELKTVDLETILRHYDMEKYFSTFEEQNINLETFLNLTEENLKNLGIKLFGPRRKMSLLINHWSTCDKCKQLCDQNF